MEKSIKAATKYVDLTRLVSKGSEERQRRTLVREIRDLGVPAPARETGEIISAFADTLKQTGVVIIGSIAFETYCGMQGLINVPLHLASTDDVDIACTMPMINENAASPPLTRANSATRRLDGNPASVDFIVPNPTPEMPADGTPRCEQHTVYVRRFESYAYVLPHDRSLLIKNPIPAVIPYGSGLPVRVPDPIRFALHKLMLSEHRTNEHKAAKDREQATIILSAFADRARNKADIFLEFAAYGQGSLVPSIRTALDKCSAVALPPDITRLLDTAFPAAHP